MPEACYYRYYDTLYSNGTDEFGDALPGGHMEVQLMTIPVLKATKCGAWIGWSESDKRFINNSWTKRWACPTIKEAQESYIARKKREIALYQGRINYAQEALQKGLNLFAGRSPWAATPELDGIDS